jgi:hypothetical protein
MRAKFRAHGWVKLPAGMSDEDRAAVMAILARYELRATAVLTEGGGDAEVTDATEPA